MKRSNHSSSRIRKKIMDKDRLNSLTIPYSFHFSDSISKKSSYVSNQLLNKQVSPIKSEDSIVTIKSTTSFLLQGRFGTIDTINPFVFYESKFKDKHHEKQRTSDLSPSEYPYILLNDITIHLGNSWHPSKSFVKAADENGDELRLNQLSVIGEVNHNIPGTYEVWYSYNEMRESANIVVKKPLHDIQIDVREVSLSVGDAWNPKQSFIKAVDEYDEDIPFERITVSDSVDTTVPGLTMLFFKYNTKVVPIYITVEHRLPTIDEEKDIGAMIVDLVNKLREKLDISAVVESNQLMEIAKTRASDLPILYSHTRPNGDNCFTLYKERHYEYTEAGENIGYIKARGTTFQNASAIFLQWKNSAGHYANLINPEYTEMGVGIYSDERTDRIIYASLNFGRQQNKPTSD